MKLLWASLLVLLAIQPALAGTKYITNIVPTANDGPSLSAKSKIIIKDNTLLKVVLKNVAAANGSLVTTDKSFANGILTGDEYVVVVRGSIVSIDLDIDLNVVLELKGGKGVAKTNIVDVIDLLPGNLVQSIGWRGVSLHGPLGEDAIEGCAAVINGSQGISLPPAPNPCATGPLVGRSGIVAP